MTELITYTFTACQILFLPKFHAEKNILGRRGRHQGCSILSDSFIVQNIFEVDTIIKKFRSDIVYFVCP